MSDLAALEERLAAEERINRDQQTAIARLQAELDNRDAGTKRAWEAAKEAYAERDRLREALICLNAIFDFGRPAPRGVIVDSKDDIPRLLTAFSVADAALAKEPTE